MHDHHLYIHVSVNLPVSILSLNELESVTVPIGIRFDEVHVYEPSLFFMREEICSSLMIILLSLDEIFMISTWLPDTNSVLLKYHMILVGFGLPDAVHRILKSSPRFLLTVVGKSFIMLTGSKEQSKKRTFLR